VAVRQLARFLAVGVSNTALSLAAYAALLAAAAPTAAAAARAFAAGAANGYVLNRAWTFGARDSLASRARFVTVQAGGIAANGALVALLVDAVAGRLAAYTWSRCRRSRSRPSSRTAAGRSSPVGHDLLARVLRKVRLTAAVGVHRVDLGLAVALGLERDPRAVG
jgi:putative flippase GtrA